MHLKNVGYIGGHSEHESYYQPNSKHHDPNKTISIMECKNEMCPLKEIAKKQQS